MNERVHLIHACAPVRIRIGWLGLLILTWRNLEAVELGQIQISHDQVIIEASAAAIACSPSWVESSRYGSLSRPLSQCLIILCNKDFAECEPSLDRAAQAG